MGPILVATSDKHIDRLPLFFYFLEKYWQTHPAVAVVGFTPPSFSMPAQFHSMGEETPFSQWSNPIIEFLERATFPHFLFMLEDYYLIRDVDHRAVQLAFQFMRENPDVVRFDLTSDRHLSGRARDAGYLGHLDLVESDPASPYHMSLQAAWWNRELFLDVAQNDESCHDLEIFGTSRLGELNHRVFGTKQCPVRHGSILRKDTDGFQLSGFRQEDREIIEHGRI